MLWARLQSSVGTGRLARRGCEVAAVDGDERAGGVARQREVDKGGSDILGGNLAAQQVAAHVLGLADAVRPGALGDHLRGQQAAADAVGVDRVGADAVAAVFERIRLPGEDRAARVAERTANGIPIPGSLKAALDKMAVELGIRPLLS